MWYLQSSSPPQASILELYDLKDVMPYLSHALYSHRDNAISETKVPRETRGTQVTRQRGKCAQCFPHSTSVCPKAAASTVSIGVRMSICVLGCLFFSTTPQKGDFSKH